MFKLFARVKAFTRRKKRRQSEEDQIMQRLFGGTADWKSMDLVVQRDALQAEVNRLSKKVEELPYKN